MYKNLKRIVSRLPVVFYSSGVLNHSFKYSNIAKMKYFVIFLVLAAGEVFGASLRKEFFSI